ncbi:hypothetical protein RhiirB3_528632 [Rhizophagus irregularis]|nr:hypothetical protein RhiirB3_528632 [Rhizophagus irregularis]
MYDSDGYQIIKIYEEMKSRGIKSTVLTYNCLIRAMILREEKERAKEFFREMKSEGIKPNVLILDSLGITGLDAIQKLQDSNGVNLNLLDYNILLRGCTYLQNNENEKAIESFNRMKNDNFKKSEVIRLLDSASKLEDSKVIEKLFHTISKTESQLSNVAFEKILWCVAQGDYYLNNREKCNILTRNTIYESIIEGFIQKDDDKILYNV